VLVILAACCLIARGALYTTALLNARFDWAFRWELEFYLCAFVNALKGSHSNCALWVLRFECSGDVLGDKLDSGVVIELVAVTFGYVEFKVALCGGVGKVEVLIILIDDVVTAADVDVLPEFGPLLFKLGAALVVLPDFNA